VFFPGRNLEKERQTSIGIAGLQTGLESRTSGMITTEPLYLQIANEVFILITYINPSLYESFEH
jgi:hypothetical protein